MKMLLDITLPHQPFNAAVKDGTAGSKLNRILEATKPEAVYFTEQHGQRGAILVVDLPDASKLPALVDTTYFGQSSSSLMINYRVANLDRMLEQLRKSGVKIEKVEDYAYGRFAWIMDPEGNRIELWEPKGK